MGEKVRGKCPLRDRLGNRKVRHRRRGALKSLTIPNARDVTRAWFQPNSGKGGRGSGPS